MDLGRTFFLPVISHWGNLTPKFTMQVDQLLSKSQFTLFEVEQSDTWNVVNMEINE